MLIFRDPLLCPTALSIIEPTHGLYGKLLNNCTRRRFLDLLLLRFTAISNHHHHNCIEAGLQLFGLVVGGYTGRNAFHQNADDKLHLLRLALVAELHKEPVAFPPCTHRQDFFGHSLQKQNTVLLALSKYKFMRLTFDTTKVNRNVTSSLETATLNIE